MTREILRLQARRFTSAGALAKEIDALLRCTDYELIVEVPWQAKKMLESEMYDSVGEHSGRVKLEVVKEAVDGYAENSDSERVVP